MKRIESKEIYQKFFQEQKFEHNQKAKMMYHQMQSVNF